MRWLNSAVGRDVWQLHVPLVVALGISSVATYIEVSRALDGVQLAWVYVVQWPMIGVFCVWMWVRLRREGRSEAQRSGPSGAGRPDTGPPADVGGVHGVEDMDPDLLAWREYQRQVRSRDAGRANGAGPSR